MKFNNWKDLAETVGVLAIVGSLIFVGLQIKQEQAIALSEINLSLLASQIELDNSISDHTDIWARGNAGESLEESERVVFNGLLNNMAYLHRTEWRQHESFDQDRHKQVALADFALHLHNNPGARESWIYLASEEERNRNLLIPSFESGFRKAILAKLEELDQLQ